MFSNILSHINKPNDLKNLNIKEKEQLANEIREKIINTVSKQEDTWLQI